MSYYNTEVALHVESNEELVRRIQYGDNEAATILFEKNRKFITYIIKKFKPDPNVFDDLYSVSTLGFIKAYKTFNVDKQIRFSTYCGHLIYNEILMYYRREKKHQAVTQSLQESVSESGDLTLQEVLLDKHSASVESIASYSELYNMVLSSSNHLTKRQRTVLGLSAIGLNQMQVACKINISQAQVSRLLRAARERLRLCLNHI